MDTGEKTSYRNTGYSPLLVRMMEDREVPFGVRAKIAQDLLDRAGLIAAQVHQIIPTTEDPIMRFKAPIHSGDPGYARHPDRDYDGIGCEWS